jgi:phenylalanine-4-hydroxylase
MTNQPDAPSAQPVALRGDYAHAADDYSVAQEWEAYSDADHDVWRTLYARQILLLHNYAAPEFIAGTQALGASPDRIPRIDATNQVLREMTGWSIVTVPGLIPETQFFAHLAARRFPVTKWIRRRDELDYLAEPDIFHDFFGHVPLLTNPVFASFMQAYGAAGSKASAAGALHMLARLYWYMVEFGLIRTARGLRVYGAGILSSKSETEYSLKDPRPHRIAFELERVMLTRYLIDDFQQTYFVIDDFEQLFHAGYDTDFAPIYARFHDTPGLSPQIVLPTDRVIGL